MFDLSNTFDLPLIWGVIIALAVFLYVFLDGFDLGIGILFPFAPSNKCRDRMMNSIAPFWDGNETWLVLGGGGLLAAFPLAYAILLPAFYLPIIFMLLGLILRGVSFEFRFKTHGRSQRFWDYTFHVGSLVAAFFQGMILGGFVQGVQVTGRNFSGGAFDWATPFSFMIGFALVCGYALLGATWLIMKTEDTTQNWARRMTRYALISMGFFMLAVSAWMPYINSEIRSFWFQYKYILAILPLFTAISWWFIWQDVSKHKHEFRPFILALSIFVGCYLGLAISFYPWLVPFHYTLWNAAAAGPSLTLLLVGVVPLLPIILIYTGYSYYVFRGKTSHEHSY